MVLNRGGEITPYELDQDFFKNDNEPKSAEIQKPSLSVEENEKGFLNALLKAGGNRTKAAEMMGISRRTLHRKLSKWPELDVGKIYDK